MYQQLFKPMYRQPFNALSACDQRVLQCKRTCPVWRPCIWRVSQLELSRLLKQGEASRKVDILRRWLVVGDFFHEERLHAEDQPLLHAPQLFFRSEDNKKCRCFPRVMNMSDRTNARQSATCSTRNVCTRRISRSCTRSSPVLGQKMMKTLGVFPGPAL